MAEASTVAGFKRRRHDYGQVAVVGQLARREPHGGVAFERFTPEGPDGAAARGGPLRLRVDDNAGAGRGAAQHCPTREFTAALERRAAARVFAQARSPDG